MGEATKIEWCDHTWNPVVGCTKVSPACDNCYAESWAKRTGQSALWNGERRRTSDSNWRQPVKWNAAAKRDGIRRRVFCASLADVFDNQWDPEWRAAMWDMIEQCDSLDWLLLTKRPQNIRKMLPPGWLEHDGPWSHVWLGATVENQEEADRRIPHLMAVPAVWRFLSCEPLLSEINLEPYFDGIGWVIVGGESGPRRREMDLRWARSIHEQCRAYHVPFFGKQWDKVRALPNDLMVRQFPAAADGRRQRG